ncbi:50S ribosomal protein L18 [Methanosarcinales archaeon ex4572_44]|nr:MAG: 50S ribosomal protein L18 [Methanosarcinales archaeon ex4484_138]PHP46221.1 MAG: 50S ribosomal protein L18 [Methanosarcinales archaeon ex4572_44]RLG27712.1 MAG: 50S ribosomal protein L18 [Methanosarcinales archaeon]HHI30679.1 50S ribosomal protein L18 [Candidatus Methanoperedenaceae archaeon]
MARGPGYKVAFRRRREGRTNYHSRRKLIISGKPRLVIRKSLKHTQIQLVTAEQGGDKTHVSAISTELKKYGYTCSTSNTSAAYLTGLLMGYRMLDSGLGSAILDIGLHPAIKGSRVYAAVKGARDAGVDIPCDERVFPSDERIHGQAAAEYNGNEIPAQFEAAVENINNLYEE